MAGRIREKVMDFPVQSMMRGKTIKKIGGDFYISRSREIEDWQFNWENHYGDFLWSVDLHGIWLLEKINTVTMIKATDPMWIKT